MPQALRFFVGHRQCRRSSRRRRKPPLRGRAGQCGRGGRDLARQGVRHGALHQAERRQVHTEACPMTRSQIARRASRQVNIAGVRVGGDAPIVVQSMTNTDTADVAKTVAPGQRPAAGGFGNGAYYRQFGRSGRPVGPIRRQLDAMGCTVPLVGDFHYNGHRLLAEYPDCARDVGQVPHQSRQCRQQARNATNNSPP